MARKLAKLTQVMADDTALVTPNVNWNAPTILPPAIPAATDKFAQPEMPEGFSALLIMHGLQAKWCLNYWRLSNRNGAVAHVSARNDWDEWQSAVKNLANTVVTRA